MAVSAFVTYGVEQTMWGTYAFDLAGQALALAILWVTIMPLVVLQLLGKFRMPAAPGTGRPEAALPEEPQPPSAAAMPEQPIYYGTPYPQEPDAYEGDYIKYDEEGEEWEEEEEGDEDYYEDEPQAPTVYAVGAFLLPLFSNIPIFTQQMLGIASLYPTYKTIGGYFYV